MKSLAIYFLALVLTVFGIQRNIGTEECRFEKLDSEDSSFCRGDLEVIYPELGDVGCSYIPECDFYRKRISKEWKSPRVRYRDADKNKKYVLIMVDPDAPSRANPIYRFWRHWVITDIKGIDLMNGYLQGHVLSAYRRPSPPSGSGFHRYQFLIFEQPKNEDISFDTEEDSTLSSWNMEDFMRHFHLGMPVATTQFMTKNYED